MKAPSHRGVPIPGRNTVPGFAWWHLTRRKRARLLSRSHWQASSRSGHAWGRPYLPLAGLVTLVENESNSSYGSNLGALATLAWVCFVRVGEVATVQVADIALPGAIQFWKSKTGEERYTTRPLSRAADQVRECA